MARPAPVRGQTGSPPWLGVSASTSLLPRSSEGVRSPVDCDCEAVGECEAHRDGGRRFAGLSGREKQGWRDGASAEQGSSLAAKRAKQQLVTGIGHRRDARGIKNKTIELKLSVCHGTGQKQAANTWLCAASRCVHVCPWLMEQVRRQ